MATDMTPPAGAMAFLAAHGWAGAGIAPLAGDASFRRYFRVVEGGRRAVLLIALRAYPAGPFPRYDRTVLQREAALFVDWYCPSAGLLVDADGYRDAWDRVLGLADAAEPVTVLRDYHSENLMLTGAEPMLALLDFQDALAGHPAYDLVSLLQDARRDVDPELERLMLTRYRAARGQENGFADAYHVLGAQRNAKILGIFARLWRRDGKPRYAALCPRVWSYLERDLRHPALVPVARWFDGNVPPEARGDPALLAAR